MTMTVSVVQLILGNYDDDGERHHEPRHHHIIGAHCCSRLSQIMFQLSLFLSPFSSPSSSPPKHSAFKRPHILSCEAFLFEASIQLGRLIASRSRPVQSSTLTIKESESVGLVQFSLHSLDSSSTPSPLFSSPSSASCSYNQTSSLLLLLALLPSPCNRLTNQSFSTSDGEGGANFELLEGRQLKQRGLVCLW